MRDFHISFIIDLFESSSYRAHASCLHAMHDPQGFAQDTVV